MTSKGSRERAVVGDSALELFSKRSLCCGSVAALSFCRFACLCLSGCTPVRSNDSASGGMSALNAWSSY